jgi:hypothetical protein
LIFAPHLPSILSRLLPHGIFFEMSFVPRVTEKVRELVARDFDARGPDVCMAEIVKHLERHNPEILDMAVKCAADSDSPDKALMGFSMFYRLLIVQLSSHAGGAALIMPPRVSAETRALLVSEIDEIGTEAFIMKAIAELQESNPELLQMAHNFAAGLKNYLHVMQGFALLYKSLLMQSQEERGTLH